MTNNLKTCKNGHNFDSKLSECPYCPKPSLDNRNVDSNTDKTIIENQNRTDKTIIENSNDFNKVRNPDNTIYLKQPENKLSGVKSQDYRKLVGWVVTYDLSPEGSDFKLREGKTLIGRDSKNDVIIPSSEISEQHCILLYRNGKLLLNDSLSTNGTFLNGEMIEDKEYVNNDDIITLGRISLKVKLI